MYRTVEAVGLSFQYESILIPSKNRIANKNRTRKTITCVTCYKRRC